MHITLETDYAIRIVDCLVKANKRMDAKSISESTDVSLRFALKILRKLVGSGMIKSFKGTRGGYELAKDPSDITLYNVVETIEGKYLFSRCLKDSTETEPICYKIAEDGECNCSYRHVFKEISDMVEKRLSKTTFDQFDNLIN